MKIRHERPQSDAGAALTRGGGEMARLIREFAWSKTPLGPLETWPSSVHTAVSLCLNSHLPIVLFLGPDLTVLYNNACIPILGKGHPRALGEAGATCWGEIWPDLGPALERVRATGQPAWSDDLCLLIDREGYQEEMRVSFSHTPIGLEVGEIFGSFTTLSVTPQKPGSRIGSADLVHEHLYDLITQAPVPIAVLQGAEHRFELANPAYAQLVGNRELVGKTFREALPEVEGQGFYTWLDQVYLTGEAHVSQEHFAQWGRHSDSVVEDGYVNFIFQPMRSEEGTVAGILILAVDVTDQVFARHGVEKVAASLQEVDQRKDTFLHLVGHELRNPLTTIKGNVQYAQRSLKRLMKLLAEQLDPISEPIRHIVTNLTDMNERSIRQVEVQNRLISDLMDTARLRVGKLELSLHLCDLALLVRETVLNQRSADPIRRITLEEDSETPLWVMIDRDRIAQVLSNYLTNAAKYSPASEPIEVGITRQAKSVRVWVRDRGPGLSEQQQQHIWEHFYQVPGIGKQSGSGQGLGLGLAICQSLISRHHGEVGVTSRVGEGSTFWFSLQLVEQAEPPA